MATAKPPWFQDGLRFSCTRCGDCCSGEGYVWVDRVRARQIARFLELPLESFSARYLRRIGRRLSLVDREDLKCVFWDDACTIYPVRPLQCRTFPFWSRNLSSPEAWDLTCEDCPGAGSGRLYSESEIESLSRSIGSTSEAEGGKG